MTVESYQVREERKPDHAFRTEIPNIVFELGLNPYELTMYAYYKKVAGDNGQCWQSQATIQKATGISPESQKKAYERLRRPFELLGGASLIRLYKTKTDQGGDAPHQVLIVDIWRTNGDYHRNQKSTTVPPVAVPPPADSGTPSRQQRDKEEPYKNNPRRKTAAAADPASPSLPPKPTDSPEGSSSATVSRHEQIASDSEGGACPPSSATPPQAVKSGLTGLKLEEAKLDPRLEWIEEYVGAMEALDLQVKAATQCYPDGRHGYELWRQRERAKAMKEKGNPPRIAWFRAAIAEDYDFGLKGNALRDSGATEAPSWPFRVSTWLRSILGDRVMVTGDTLTILKPDENGVMIPWKAVKLSKKGLKPLIHRLKQYYNEPKLAEIPQDLLA